MVKAKRPRHKIIRPSQKKKKRKSSGKVKYKLGSKEFPVVWTKVITDKDISKLKTKGDVDRELDKAERQKREVGFEVGAINKPWGFEQDNPKPVPFDSSGLFAYRARHWKSQKAQFEKDMTARKKMLDKKIKKLQGRRRLI